MDKLKENRGFLIKLLTLAVPIILQQLIATLLNLVDNVMIGSLGEVSIAAVGIANQIFFIMMLTVFGVCGGMSIFVAQFWGSKDVKSIKKTMGIGLLIACAVAGVFWLIAFIAPVQCLGFYSNDEAVIAEGVRYIRIAAFSYLPLAVTCVYGAALRNTGQVRLPLIVSSIALLLNTLINYTLIYGYFGFPQLGTRGAAIATVIARTFEMLLAIGIIYGKKYELAAKIKEMFCFDWAFFKKFLDRAAFVIFNELMWGAGTTIYMAIYGRIGTNQLAAANISGVIFNIIFVVAIGIGSACAVMIGNALGASEFDEARGYAKKSMVISVGIGLIVGGITALFIPQILKLYTVSEEVKIITKQVLYAIMFILPLVCLQFTLFIGVLRPGGETKFCAVADIFALWCVGIPAAAIGGFIFHLPMVFVFLLTKLETLTCTVLCFIRYKSGKWVNNIVNEE